jgi:hypothetical protein
MQYVNKNMGEAVALTDIQTIANISYAKDNQSFIPFADSPENQPVNSLLSDNQVHANLSAPTSTPNFFGNPKAVGALSASFNTQLAFNSADSQEAPATNNGGIPMTNNGDGTFSAADNSGTYTWNAVAQQFEQKPSVWAPNQPTVDNSVILGGQQYSLSGLQSWVDSVNQNGVAPGGEGFYNLMTQPQKIPLDNEGNSVTAPMARVDAIGNLSLNVELIPGLKGGLVVANVNSDTTAHENVHAGDSLNSQQAANDYNQRDETYPLINTYLLTILNNGGYDLSNPGSDITETNARAKQPDFQAPISALKQASDSQTLTEAVNGTLLPLIQAQTGMAVTSTTLKDGSVQLVLPPNFSNPTQWVVLNVSTNGTTLSTEDSSYRTFATGNLTYTIATGPDGRSFVSNINSNSFGDLLANLPYTETSGVLAGVGTVTANLGGAFDSNKNLVTITPDQFLQMVTGTAPFTLSQTDAGGDRSVTVDPSTGIWFLNSLSSNSKTNQTFTQGLDLTGEPTMFASPGGSFKTGFNSVDSAGAQTGVKVILNNDESLTMSDQKGNSLTLASDGKITTTGSVSDQQAVVSYLQSLSNTLSHSEQTSAGLFINPSLAGPNPQPSPGPFTVKSGGN